MRVGVFVVTLTVLVFTSLAERANAVVLDLTLFIEASEFVPVDMSSKAPPITDFRYDVRVVFDNSSSFVNQTAGLTVLNSNLPPLVNSNPQVRYSYNSAQDTLLIGPSDAGGLDKGSDFRDFRISISNVSTAPEIIVGYAFGLATPYADWEFRSNARLVPEPAHMSVLALIGVAGFVELRRSRAKRTAATA